ncbi:N-acetylmuramoyl-L-alanine amidase, family 3 [Roseibacterium elongatum DSM 19469]|uniref:N-acetylmuramoyl-L-alanine amidase, family 3 n=1 Tax=Roseicyclus elongatus DSM 19469 TaxID=1294273 RepID=W8RP60_9RHOB|nr:SH3 domain-containing protein [Roseibacterium elongatum]AHM02909.1 N-acetylmuramoyl-L-alanine amidase, family 3 [Roseibacterium elongatum DSM 19469]
MTLRKIAALALAAAALVAPQAALAGDCTGYVTGIRPVSSYNHAAGNGFLAVRSGPGTGYQQIGELYLGDEISVWARSGNWYQVQCMTGRCQTPLWGQANPNGWVYGRYLSIGGVCP